MSDDTFRDGGCHLRTSRLGYPSSPLRSVAGSVKLSSMVSTSVTVSAPSPVDARSEPLLPLIVSSPCSPRIVSFDQPPSRMSAPSPPTIVSEAPLPSMTSSPSCPKIRSRPLSPAIVSSPWLPSMRSGLFPVSFCRRKRG